MDVHKRPADEDAARSDERAHLSPDDGPQLVDYTPAPQPPQPRKRQQAEGTDTDHAAQEPAERHAPETPAAANEDAAGDPLEGVELASLEVGDAQDRGMQGWWRALNQPVSLRRADDEEPCVGLDIGSRTLRAAVVHDGVPLHLFEWPLPEGVVERGTVADVKRLARELRAFWRAAGLASKDVNFGVGNRQVTMRTLTLPATGSEEELYLAVSNTARTVLEPLDTKTAILDFAELTRGANHVQVLLAAAEQQMVRDFREAIERAGLNPIACELGPVAETRSLLVPRDPDTARLVVSIGAQTTSVIAASGPDVFFLRVLEIGGDDFTRAVAQRFGCGFEEAEELKRAVGLGEQPAGGEIDAEKFDAYQEALLGVSDKLAQMLSDTRRFYESTPDGRPVASVMLVGSGAHLRGLAEQLELAMGGAPVTPPTPRAGLEAARFADYARAIGLALRQDMSLLPETGRRFALSGTRRAKAAKISEAAAKRNARKVRGRMRRRAQQMISPQLLGFALAALGVGGCFFFAQQANTDIEDLRVQVDAAQAQQPQLQRVKRLPRYQPGAEGVSNAQNLASLIYARPDLRVLPRIMDVLAGANVTDQTVEVAPESMTVGGVAPDGSKIDRIAGKIAQIDGVADVERLPGPTAHADGTQPFQIKVRTKQ